LPSALSERRLLRCAVSDLTALHRKVTLCHKVSNLTWPNEHKNARQ
jgi:hypothetical protein